jgi:hypothetical protein
VETVGIHAHRDGGGEEKLLVVENGEKDGNNLSDRMKNEKVLSALLMIVPSLVIRDIFNRIINKISNKSYH